MRALCREAMLGVRSGCRPHGGPHPHTHSRGASHTSRTNRTRGTSRACGVSGTSNTSSDSGASGWQTLWNVIIPLSRTGIIIGSIFVITIVMGDFVTIGVMGGQQIASIGKIIQVQTSYLQFPLAAANAVILLSIVLMIIWALTRVVDIRKEL